MLELSYLDTFQALFRFSHEVIDSFNERRHHPLPVLIQNVFLLLLLLRLLIRGYKMEDELFMLF